MNAKYVLELIEVLGGLEVVENLVYREIQLIEERGDPTSDRYNDLQELYKMCSELS